MKPLFAIAALATMCWAPAAAQDPTVVDSDHYKLVFENDQVRVLRVTYGPGEESVMHMHPGHVAISLTASSWTMTFPNGESMELGMAADEVVWAPAGSHRPRNLSDKAAEVILVEVKAPMDMGDHDEDHDDEDDG